MKKLITLILFLFACGDEADFADVELGQSQVAWTAKPSTTAGVTWGSQENLGNTACTKTAASNCFFHGHHGGDTLSMGFSYWVHSEWSNSEETLIEGLVDTFVSNATTLISLSPQTQLPWSFQRLDGTVEPSNANVVIRAGFANGTLSNTVGQYVTVDWDDSNCFKLDEPTLLTGSYYRCNSFVNGNPGTDVKVAKIIFALDDLNQYMIQEGYTESQKTATRRHVLWHGLLAELGLGGVNSSTSPTKKTFSKTTPVNQFITAGEQCRWRGLFDKITNNGNPTESHQFKLSATTCAD